MVDAANPRVLQQIASVNKIIEDLHFGEIPQLIVLNKSDLLKRAEIDRLAKQIKLDSGLESVSISAIRRDTLRPMVEAIGGLLNKSEMVIGQYG